MSHIPYSRQQREAHDQDRKGPLDHWVTSHIETQREHKTRKRQQRLIKKLNIKQGK